MKATGIVRRLDDLGRLVIPKEIRKIYQLKEGDSIEFFVSEEKEIIIRKYEHLNENKTEIQNMLESFEELFKQPLLFYGDDHLYTAANQYQNKELSKEIIQSLISYHEEAIRDFRLFQKENTLYNGTLFPLVVDSHWLGCFISLENPISETKKAVIHSYIKLLTRQMPH